MVAAHHLKEGIPTMTDDKPNTFKSISETSRWCAIYLHLLYAFDTPDFPSNRSSFSTIPNALPNPTVTWFNPNDGHTYWLDSKNKLWASPTLANGDPDWQGTSSVNFGEPLTDVEWAAIVVRLLTLRSLFMSAYTDQGVLDDEN